MPGHDFATGEVLTAANVDAYLNNSFYFYARQTVAQTLADSTFTGITFSTEDFDTDSGHSTSSNTSRFVCQTAGVYLLAGCVSYTGSTTNQRYARFALNGTAVNGSATRLTGSANSCAVPARTVILTLAVSDYVELQGHQNTGGNLDTLVTSDLQSSFLVWRMSS